MPSQSKLMAYRVSRRRLVVTQSKHHDLQSTIISSVPKEYNSDTRFLYNNLYSSSIVAAQKFLVVLVERALLYVCIVTHIARVWINRVRLPILLVVS